MARPVTLPNTFGTATSPEPMVALDQNFGPLASAFNDPATGFWNVVTTDTGTANNYVVALAQTPSGYTSGFAVAFVPANSNTGASVINVNALGNVPIVSSNNTALTGGEITAATMVGVVYDGTSFRIFSQPTSAITAVRLRSFNAVGNPSFEVDQRNVFAAVGNIANGAFGSDRWAVSTAGTMRATYQAFQGQTTAVVPGTSFLISQGQANIQVSTVEATLATGDYWMLGQSVEGPFWRELSNDVTSVSILCQSTIANLKFALALRSASAAQSLVKLCTIPTANTWTLITLPNIPKPTSGTFVTTPGNVGYMLSICLACGTSLIAPALDTWQAGNFIGAPGMSNMFATSVANFIVSFIQHEPGALCTTLIDKPFAANYDECLRYYQKSYDYGTAIGTVTGNGALVIPQLSTAALYGIRFYKPMARANGVAIYNHSNGAVNTFQHTNATIYTVSSVNGLGQSGWITTSTSTMPAPTAGAGAYAHWIADTGW